MEIATQLKPAIPSIEAIQAGLEYHIQNENSRRHSGPPQPHRYIYASSRRRCLRRSAYECLHPEKMPEYSADQKARFLRGEQREVDLRVELTKAGQFSEPRFEFVGIQQPVKIHDRKGRLIISGRTDGDILWETKADWPAEIKAWAQNLVERIDTFEDIYRNPFTWSGAHQLLAYQYSKGVPYGVFVLDRSGLPKLVGVDLEANLEYMESFLRDAETIVDHLDAGELPECCQDKNECRRCPFLANPCNPRVVSGPGVKVFTDPEVEARLMRMLELEPAADEYAGLEKWSKEAFRGIEHGVAGSVMIGGKWQRDTRIVGMPDDVKARIKALQDPYRQQLQQGRWFASFTKV